MGCFVSCFRSKDQEKRRSNSDSYHDLKESLGKQCFVENEIGSLSLNGETEKEEKVGHLEALEEKLTQEAKQLKLCGEIQETSMEISQLNKKIAFQELNGSDQSSKSAQNLSNNKIQSVAHCEQENNPDQAIMSTPSLGKENSTSHQSTPGTASSEETRGCKLDQTQVSNGTGVLISDPNSPYRVAMTMDGEMEVSSVVKSVELEKKNVVSGELSNRTKKCYEYTPKFVVSDLSQQPNGIPNTTTKYKEDQQVKWHATPFEERLERILSDETMPPPRELISGRLIQLEE
ncbi:uncharacterized protein LOC144549031 [Carex rostrata]